jgi:recombination protein RecA
LLDIGVQQNLIEKSGSWFSYKGERIGQGRENARQYLLNNTELTMKLDGELRGVLKLTAAA